MADKQHSISIRVDLQEKDFKAKIKSLQSEMNELRSELSLAEKQYTGQQNSLDALTAKYNIYNKMLNTTNNMINAHESVIKRLSTDYDIVKSNIDGMMSQQTVRTKEAEKALSDFEAKYTGVARNFPWYKKKHEELANAVEFEKTKTAEIQDVLEHYSTALNKSADGKLRYKTLTEEEVKELVRLANQQRDIEGAIQRHTTAQNKLREQSLSTNQAIGELSQGIDRAKESADKADPEMDRFTGKLKETEQAAEALADAMAVQLVQKGFNVVKEAFTESIKAFKDYETALAGVSKTTGMEWGGGEIKALGDDFKALSQQIPVSATELLNVAQIAGQLGIQGSEDIQKFTTVMAQMSVSTNLSAEEAATALAQMAAVTGMAASDYDKLGSAIVSLGNKYPVAEDTIVRIAQRFSGAATNANLAESSIVALAAAAGSVGIQAESAGTSLTKLVAKMGDAVSSGDNLNKWAKVAGMSAEEFAYLWGENAPDAIAKFLYGFGQLGEEATQTFSALGIGESRLQDLIRRMSNAEASSRLLTNALQGANEAFSDGTALANEANVAYETLNSKTEILKNSINVLGIEVGTVLAPQMSTAVEAGTQAVQLVSNLIEKAPELVYALEAFTLALGYLTIQTLPQSFESISNLVKGFERLISVMGAQAGAVGAVILAFAALAYVIRNWSDEGDVAAKKSEDVREAYEDQAEVASRLAEETEKLNDIQALYDRELEECGQASQDTADALDEQKAVVDALQEALDGLEEETETAAAAQKTFAEAARVSKVNVDDLTASFEENLAKVKNFSTEYTLTAQKYVENMQQQIEWNNKYSENREKVLSHDIEGLREWVLSWDDGTAEAAELMNAFANATEEDLVAAVAKWRELTQAEKDNSASFRESASEYNATLDEMVQSTTVHIEKIQATIDGLHGKDIYVRVNAAGGIVGNQYITANAQGLDYVPRDDFLTMLHEGERVLNRAEATAYRQLERSAVTTNNTTKKIVFNVTQQPGENGAMLARRMNRLLGEVY